jgi:hexaprenyl-diphosphate synthase
VVAPELDALRQSLLSLLGSAHPGLDEIAKYYFLHPSKQMRPLLVLLFARATNGLGQGWREKRWAAECDGAGGRAEELDRPLTRADVLNDYNPSMPDNTTSFANVFSLIPPAPPPPRRPLPATFLPGPPSPMLADLLPTQRRLAQIVEMIHVASLLHDDVIDASALRRGAPSAPAAFGNKLAVLGGDFLLGRASTALARLGDTEVVELIASVIANLVEGEILQMKDVHGGRGIKPSGGADAWAVYLKKTYLKTASLMAKGCRASAILGGCTQGEVWKELAYAFGRNFGLAFQVPSFPPFLKTLCKMLIYAPVRSWWTTYSTTKRARRRSASPAAPTSNWDSPPGPHSTPGKSTPRWAPSSSASSIRRATSSW